MVTQNAKTHTKITYCTLFGLNGNDKNRYRSCSDTVLMEKEKKARLVAWAVAFENIEDARRRFRAQYDEDAPTSSTVRRWVDRFLEFGDINARKEGSGRPVTASGDEAFAEVKTMLDVDSTVSTREIARQVGTSQSSVCRVLHTNTSFILTDVNWSKGSQKMTTIGGANSVSG